MIAKYISFPDKIDGRESQSDFEEIPGQIQIMQENHKNRIGIGAFFIRVYREWRVMKARLDAMDRSKEYIPPK